VAQDWDQLRVFLAVARSGSIRAAAKALNTTHATVSRHVRSLEGTMDRPLFQKDRAGRRLSALGHRVLPLAEEIERQAAAIERIALSENTGLAGSLRVSLSESLYHGIFGSIFDGFMSLYPMVDLELFASDDQASLARREADVVVRITRSPPGAAVGRKLARSPLCIYAAPSYLAARPKPDRWIALQYRPAQKPVLPASVFARVNAPLAAARMIRDGKGIGMLPCYLGDTDPGLVRVPGFKPQPDLDIWLLTHADLTSAPRVRALMDYIQEHFPAKKAYVEGRAGSGDLAALAGKRIDPATLPPCAPTEQTL
jgi:DNA-binding transcriptional LysR family regulator